MSLTIHCKYKYFDSTVQRAEDRRQKFHFCRLPFAVNVMLNLSKVCFQLTRSVLFNWNMDNFKFHFLSLGQFESWHLFIYFYLFICFFISCCEFRFPKDFLDSHHRRKNTGKMKKFLAGDQICTAGCQINNTIISQTNRTLNSFHYKVDFKILRRQRWFWIGVLIFLKKLETWRASDVKIKQ